jgi:hypothetical protein
MGSDDQGGASMRHRGVTSSLAVAIALAARYRAAYRAAKSKWASMTAVEQSAIIASARGNKIAALTAIERYGQNDDSYLLPA